MLGGLGEILDRTPRPPSTLPRQARQALGRSESTPLSGRQVPRKRGVQADALLFLGPETAESIASEESSCAGCMGLWFTAAVKLATTL